MKKIKKYNLCCGDTPVDLSSAVNRYIELGYQPYSEPFMNQNTNGHYYYCQAVVQYENP